MLSKIRVPLPKEPRYGLSPAKMGQPTFTISPCNSSISSPITSWPRTNLLSNTHSSSSGIPLKLSIFSYSFPKIPKSARTTIAAASFRASAIPARDRVINFGKYKGKMMGTLPSTYLKWMADNLRLGDMDEWGRLAEEVLEDEIYRDRIEWEPADRILKGDRKSHYFHGNEKDAVAELLEISERYGWDFEHKTGWSKVDFDLLGTSKGGRIPRLGADRSDAEVRVGDLKREKKGVEEEDGGGGRSKRRERVRRLRQKRSGVSGGRAAERTVGKWREEEDGGSSSLAEGVAVRSPFPGRRESLVGKRREEEEEGGSLSPADGGAVRNRFPGRESLLKKALNRQRL